MPYITRGELRSYIGITGSEHDSVLDQMISSASEKVDIYTRRVKGTLGQGFLTHSNSSEIHWLDQQHKLTLDEWPVQSVQTFKHNDTSLTENTDYFIDTRTGIVTFIPNSTPSSVEHLTGKIEATYVAGFQTVPEQVKMACLRIGSYWFSRKGVEGMGAQLISDMQETWQKSHINQILHEELSPFLLRL